jgi:hypothetical protein
MDDSHAAAYREALELNEISKSPKTAWRAAVIGWNLPGARLPAWPRRRLSLPSRLKHIALPLDTFPPSFQADLDLYLGRLANPDPLDPDDTNAPLRALSVQQRRLEVIRFASVLVHMGKPVESLDGLAALAEPARAEQGLRWLLARNGGRKTQAVARARRRCCATSPGGT